MQMRRNKSCVQLDSPPPKTQLESAFVSPASQREPLKRIVSDKTSSKTPSWLISLARPFGASRDGASAIRWACFLIALESGQSLAGCHLELSRHERQQKTRADQRPTGSLGGLCLLSIRVELLRRRMRSTK